MNIIIQSTLKTLEKSKFIFDNLSDDIYCNSTVSPYYSSIGSHIRHILDFYDCILNMSNDFQVDLTIRKRDLLVESNCSSALNYYDIIISKLETTNFDLEAHVYVIDDLGNGKIKITYTLGALLAQANSHTIHHFAIINYILDGLKITIDDADFGYNPTTPKQGILN